MTTKPLPPLPPGAKCLRCRGQAVIPLPSHHANFCRECFLHYCRTAVRRAMKKFALSADTPLLVAVSGGKDSLALWHVLHELGYSTKGLHIDLGIEDFSEASREAVNTFAQARALPWTAYTMKDVFGHTVPEIRRRTRRAACSFCGSLKRQILNRLTVQEGFGALVTGHNLDDEAGRLLGNIVRNRLQYLEKQSVSLPSPHPKIPSKFKPLYRLEGHEIRTYCRLQGIAPLDAKCPLSRGATSHTFKEALHMLENKMPGSKRDFLFCFLDRKARLPGQPASAFNTCTQCGQPCFSGLCSVCHLKNQVET